MKSAIRSVCQSGRLIKTFVLLSLLSVSVAVRRVAIDGDAANLQLEPKPLIPVHGSWCGPSHGGYNDCCGGGPCPSCRVPRVGEFNYTMDPRCLQECPPADETDLACAWHDTCYSISGTDPVCGGTLPVLDYDQECFCNCVLTSVACQSGQPVTGVCDFFTDVAACWVCDPQTNKWECDAWDGTIDFPVSHFCHDGPSILTNWPRNGTIDFSLTSNYPFCMNPNSTFSAATTNA